MKKKSFCLEKKSAHHKFKGKKKDLATTVLKKIIRLKKIFQPPPKMKWSVPKIARQQRVQTRRLSHQRGKI